VSDTIECAIHGNQHLACVCTHLLGEKSGLGFNRGEPSVEKPFPDAWCDNCELIREAHSGWNEQSEQLLKISVLCSGCYERARLCNTRPSLALDQLADLRWKCHHCEEWHAGPCLDFCYASPAYWREEHETASRKASLLPWRKRRDTFLDEDYCAIEDRDFFIRGIIHLPIIGAAETFRWGVWGSVSRENFEKLRGMHDAPSRTDLPRMFSWLSNQIPEYPDTLNLKMYARIQEPGYCPCFQLERTEHPLSQEYHNGITAERVKAIMIARLRMNG
jgi:hypothetical protein